ncbi:hypothetical protein BH23BAC1_BH23BAC1_21060 [soil metagenome]
MDIEFIKVGSILLTFIVIIYFFKKNDEFLIILAFFFLSTGLNRYSTIIKGDLDWVRVNYAYSIFSLDDTLALEALNLFFWGTITFTLSYVFFNSENKRIAYKHIDDNNFFRKFLDKKKPLIIYLFVLFIIINSFTAVILKGAENIAYGNSYFFLFGLAIGGIFLLIFMIYRKLDFKNNLLLKSLLLIILIYSAILSYNPTLRFQFLSWMIALGYLILKDASPMKKARLYIVGGFVLIIFFSLAGVARYQNLNSLSWDEKYYLALERATATEDQNMLDGFMMVLQVYPQELEYHYGMEHLEILMRPIPRALWPSKPVGGYANKLGLNDAEKGTVGISQTIYGTFYGEGGILGILIFSITYGYFFVKLFRYANRYSSDMKYLLRGIILASVIPILRGGDIPGIIAFIGMSYWPIFLILYQYNKYLKIKPVSENKCPHPQKYNLTRIQSTYSEPQ